MELGAKMVPCLLAAMMACTGLPARALGNGSGAEGAASAGPGTAGTVSRADLAFVREAALGSMAEIELGKLAQQNGGSDAVRQFGARMVEDHTRASEELKQITSLKKIEMPMSLDAKHRKHITRFTPLKGADFDRRYMRDMVADHRKDVAVFQKAAASARDSDLKSFASRTLPKLQEHLQMAEAAAAGHTK